MSNLSNAMWIEARKVTRSKTIWFVAAAFLTIPLIAALFMLILRDPELAQQMGLISAKAQLLGGSVDWPGYTSMLEQIISVGGVFLYGFVAAWIFGREFEDGTVLSMLAVPLPRAAQLLAKFAIWALIGALMTLLLLGLALLLGFQLELPMADPALIREGILDVAKVAVLVLTTTSVVGMMASMGRGGMAGVIFIVVVVVMGQIVTVLGWGEYFPWSIPALSTGMLDGLRIGAVSYWIVAATGLAGVAGTLLWWQRADQS
jgi:ABC-2 type transport system permease protein